MITTGPLQLGAVQIVSPGTHDVIGYAYTAASEGGQRQRWLLYRNPQNALEIRPPPASMSGWSLADWKAKAALPRSAGGLWEPGSFYIRAQADVYVHGRTEGSNAWPSIPSALPEATFPEGADDFQIDNTGGRVLLVVQNDVITGQVFSVDDLQVGASVQAATVEYWSLSAVFEPLGAGGASAIAPGPAIASATEPAGDQLRKFIGEANRAWGAGCAFAIVGCSNYQGEAAPGLL